jgi:hypothetical protein
VSITGAVFENYEPSANSSAGFKYSEAQRDGNGAVSDFLEAFGGIAYRRSSLGSSASFAVYRDLVLGNKNCFNSDDITMSNWATVNGATLRAINLPHFRFPDSIQLLTWGLGSDALHSLEGGSNDDKYFRCLQFLHAMNVSKFRARGKRRK